MFDLTQIQHIVQSYASQQLFATLLWQCIVELYYSILVHLTRNLDKFKEAPPGFEPGDGGFADLCLTTWL